MKTPLWVAWVKVSLHATENGHGCRAGGVAGTTAGRRLHDMTMPHGLLSATHGRAELALVRDDHNSLPDISVGRALG